MQQKKMLTVATGAHLPRGSAELQRLGRILLQRALQLMCPCWNNLGALRTVVVVLLFGACRIGLAAQVSAYRRALCSLATVGCTF
jgi:hypothetical protein